MCFCVHQGMHVKVRGLGAELSVFSLAASTYLLNHLACSLEPFCANF